MPNHCYNRVTIYNAQDTDESREQIAKLKAIFEDENVFGQIIPDGFGLEVIQYCSEATL